MRRALSLFITAPLLFGIACDLGEPVDQDAGKNGADASAAMDASGSKDSGSGAADAGQNGADASAALDASGSKDSGSGALDAGQHGADASGVADASQTKDSGADARDAGNDAGRDAGARDGALPEYFQPTPVVCPVNSNTWGDKAVLPRDTCNGLEDRTATPTVRPKWMYWDGKVLRGPDGRYHMFSSRWPQSNGMNGWGNSEVIHAVSQSLLGPYEDKGYAYDDGPDAQSRHKGHNVTACELPDGTYCLVVSEIVPFTIFTSNSLDGPWKNRGRVQIDTNGVPLNIPPPGDQHLESNVSLVVRPDGNFQIVQRHGIIALSTTGLLGPYKVQRPTTNYPASQAPPADLASIFPNRPKHLDPLVSQAPESTYVWAEDPVIWYSGGQYHVIYNYPLTRVAYHLTSPDGIHGWTDRGLAYDPRNSKQFFSNTDGTVDHWFNMERPGVFMEGGHVTHFSFAVSDVDKGRLAGGSNNDTKVVVVAFDGTTFDRDTCQ